MKCCCDGEREIIEFYHVVLPSQPPQFLLEEKPNLNGPFIVAVNGVLQSKLGGDFTILGNVLTLTTALSINDKVAGYYEKL